ncbi:MAG TPA: ABC transporter ATP-binding protein [Acidimicrobiia bacterium]
MPETSTHPPGDPVIEARALTKRFSASVLAVDELSFVVERGQVCGMLGPNGAGKTTTLRMLVGLIQPTSGDARVLGGRVRPGLPELARVGTLIEGAAFVPHLRGLTNLRLWWESGGSPWEDAAVDAALAIAGLGDAVHRKVKTYSHGMRQRLGIARALLARPEALVLDEPTTGLDPQEIREVRRLVSRLAGEGVTILLSSHLLSEVEQTCTHLVVLDRGRLVSTGPTGALIGEADSSVYLEVDDRDAAERVLASIAGVGAVQREVGGLTVDIDGVARSEIVAALVHGGVGVQTVTARRRLEDAFLGLVGEEHAR